MMISSRNMSVNNGVGPSPTRRHKWAAFLCLGVVLAPAAWVQAEDIDFEISSGRVVPTEDFAVKFSVLGAAITSSGTDMPVTVQFKISGDPVEPFGAHNNPWQGNVNDHEPPRHYIVQHVFNPETVIDVTGTSWWTNGSKYLERNSHEQSPSVKVLRNGDPIPDIEGMGDQADAVEFIQDYIDPASGTMTMDVNQSIYLFELGTTRLTSSAADFQDLVVLVTLGKTPEDLEDDNTSFADASYD
jgi:hypothetical protein